jgi:hypothetical protein
MSRVMDPPDPGPAPGPSPLHADLIAILQATQGAERDLFAMVPDERREAGGTMGAWSAKDVRAHLAAWRSIEARRLTARARGDGGETSDDPAPGDPIDESNAMLQARYADWSWEAVDREAETSVEALLDAIGRSTHDILCECDDWSVAGIGANGVNHAVGHLPDIADLAGGLERFDSYAREIETVLRRGHLPPRDSGVILYNIACQRALSGQLDEARRLLRDAFARRHDLRESALEDPDLAALGGELAALA